jgi:hypothetical protein
MGSVFRLMALSSLLVTPGFGGPTASQLEAFERFVSRPTAHVGWSKEVGRIDSGQAHAVIVALIVEDSTATPSQMRGIRIDLTDGNRKDQAYVGEDLLDRLIAGLDDITAGLPRFLSQSHTRSCFGSAVFQQEGHAFSASVCIFGDWGFLSVGTGSICDFQFTGIQPALFAGAIARGRDELKKQ